MEEVYVMIMKKQIVEWFIKHDRLQVLEYFIWSEN